MPLTVDEAANGKACRGAHNRLQSVATHGCPVHRKQHGQSYRVHKVALSATLCHHQAACTMASMQDDVTGNSKSVYCNLLPSWNASCDGRDNPARVVEQPLPKRPVEGLVFIALLFDYIVFKRGRQPGSIIAIDSEPIPCIEFCTQSSVRCSTSCDGDQRIPISGSPRIKYQQTKSIDAASQGCESGNCFRSMGEISAQEFHTRLQWRLGRDSHSPATRLSFEHRSSINPASRHWIAINQIFEQRYCVLVNHEVQFYRITCISTKSQ